VKVLYQIRLLSKQWLINRVFLSSLNSINPTRFSLRLKPIKLHKCKLKKKLLRINKQLLSKKKQQKIKLILT